MINTACMYRPTLEPARDHDEIHPLGTVNNILLIAALGAAPISYRVLISHSVQSPVTVIK